LNIKAKINSEVPTYLNESDTLVTQGRDGAQVQNRFLVLSSFTKMQSKNEGTLVS
jgi:hypothetical protein